MPWPSISSWSPTSPICRICGISLARSCGNLATLCNDRRDFKAAKAYLDEGAAAPSSGTPGQPAEPDVSRVRSEMITQSPGGCHTPVCRIKPPPCKPPASCATLAGTRPATPITRCMRLALCIPIVEKDQQTRCGETPGGRADLWRRGHEDAARRRRQGLHIRRARGEGSRPRPAARPGDFKKLIQELDKNSTTGPETR